LQIIGTMAYKLDLPASSRVHPVFHVSCLNKVTGDKIPVQTIFPELDEEGKIIFEPESITDTRIRQLRNGSIPEFLIKWKKLHIEYSTWEDNFCIHKHIELLKCCWMYWLTQVLISKVSNKTLKIINPPSKLEGNVVHRVHNIVSSKIAYGGLQNSDFCSQGRDWDYDKGLPLMHLIFYPFIIQ